MLIANLEEIDLGITITPSMNFSFQVNKQILHKSNAGTVNDQGIL